jgi:hypothetical protein
MGRGLEIVSPWEVLLSLEVSVRLGDLLRMKRYIRKKLLY